MSRLAEPSSRKTLERLDGSVRLFIKVRGLNAVAHQHSLHIESRGALTAGMAIFACSLGFALAEHGRIPFRA